MQKEIKDIRYNVRMTQQTFDIVDSFEGNSFTSKFETLVEHSFIEKIRIDAEILKSKMKLDELKKEISEMREIKNKLNQIDGILTQQFFQRNKNVAKKSAHRSSTCS